MPTDKYKTRFPSLRILDKWCVVRSWLAGGHGRIIKLTVGPKGLQVTLVDTERGDCIEAVGLSEDPSAAILRALVKLL